MASNRQIRRWANNNGFHLGERGRIPAQVIEAYENRLAQPDESVDELEELPEDAGTEKRGRKKRISRCGFCETGHHQFCPVSVKNGSNAPKPVWYCGCSLNEHGAAA